MTVVFNNPTVRRGGIVKDGLVLNLDAADTFSYPRTGTNWYDLSGRGYHANLLGSLTYTSEYGGKFTSDGIDESVTLISTEFARVTPVRFTTQLVCVGSTALSCRNGAGWAQTINSFTLYTIADYALTNYQFSSNVSIINYVIDNDRLRRYINGQLIDNIVISTSRTTCSDNILRIGSTINSNGTFRVNLASEFHRLDIYNRALSADEIRQNFEALRGRFGI